LIRLNKAKALVWDAMSQDEKTAYQNDNVARELDGNKRVDFLFKY
jgi:hypothetical protein